MLGGRFIRLVLHLEHDGDELHAAARFAEDEIALAAAARVVVLFKVGVGKSRHAQGVELAQTVLLQALADHLRGLARLEVLIVFDHLVLLLKAALVLALHGLRFQLALRLLPGKAVFQLRHLRRLLGKLLFLFAHRLGDGQLFVRLAALKLGLELLDAPLRLGQLFRLFAHRLGNGKLLFRFAARELR